MLIAAEIVGDPTKWGKGGLLGFLECCARKDPLGYLRSMVQIKQLERTGNSMERTGTEPEESMAELGLPAPEDLAKLSEADLEELYVRAIAASKPLRPLKRTSMT
jgi:hypothetical protein